ncbi:hypothetical protein HII36_40760 [Nonomuraea sp. NN258]|uniref:hypothetical protein n=1 Tax=Nonomuraea antri TaxID=2730852 RepID=UPI001569AF8F|nr:hypothetical protein [Nonomuraea antri]NRQ38118.1 hypothetical protein [Nonomuraea antri]
MRRVGDDEHFNRLLSAARAYWGQSPGGDRCVVAEAFHQDIRVVVRTLLVAKAICGLTSARLVVLAGAEWKRLAEAFGAADDVHPDASSVALVTSRADGEAWDVPVIRIEGAGTLKAYASFPGPSAAAQDDAIGAFFDRWVWPNRDLLRPGAERVAWRARSDYQAHTETERRQLRYYGCARLGIDPAKPTIAVFDHDGPLFQETAQFAARDDSANWLFLGPAAERYPARLTHLADTLSTNLLWSMTDVAVATRAVELPAFGIPVIQPVRSEWSGCGAAHVAESPSDYWRLLDEAISRHEKGESVLGPEQRERARLWLWLRRCGADVPSALLPHWELGADADFLRSFTVNLRHAERDGDLLYDAVRRMWQRREPMLTRFDFQDPAALSAALIPSRSLS